MRIAIVHDWLYVIGGAERVLTEMLKCFPEADVFTLFDFLSNEDRRRIGLKVVHTSFLQKLPGVRKHHHLYLPLMPIAVEQFDLSAYDLVVSSSYAVARGVITGPNQVHVSYVHSPMRYAWDLQHVYLRQSGMGRGLKGVATRMLLHYLRVWDVRTAHGVDAIVANSAFVARRIRKAYGREASVISPPVTIFPSTEQHKRGDYFLSASRLVPYKNIDLIVGAFSRMPDLRLLVAGAGPEEDRLKAMAGPNVAFLGRVSDEEMRGYMGRARAFIFAAEEDFGIVPLEAQAEGTPVIAYGRGGALETIVAEGPRPTGLFFRDPTEDSLMECVRHFIDVEQMFDAQACRLHAQGFSAEVFRRKFMLFIERQLQEDRMAPSDLAWPRRERRKNLLSEVVS